MKIQDRSGHKKAQSEMDRLLLANAMLGGFLAGLSARIFMISLPSIASGLGSDILGIAWALISFQLAQVSLGMAFGRLGDIYGRQRIYGLGFVILTVSSILCAFSQNATQLIAFRFLQGVGAAINQSAARSLAMDAMPAGSEGKAQGIMSMAFHSGFFVGPVLGGFIIDYIHWRGIFFFLALLGLAGIVLSAVRAKRRPQPALAVSRSSLDYLGVGLLAGIMVMLILLLDRRAAEVAGFGQKGFLAIAFAGSLWLFLAHERKAASPLLNLSLFKIRMFAYSAVSLLILSTSRGLVGFLMPFYLQEVLHITPSFMGIMFLVPPIFAITLSTLGGRMTDRIGPRIPATIGVLASLGAVLIGTTLKVDSHWVLPTVMLALAGIDSGFFDSSNQTAVIGSVPKEHRGLANGIGVTGFELGHMLGVSISRLLLTLAFEYYSGITGVTPSAQNPAAFVSSINAIFVAGAVFTLIALFSSIMRGSGRIQAAKKG